MLHSYKTAETAVWHKCTWAIDSIHSNGDSDVGSRSLSSGAWDQIVCLDDVAVHGRDCGSADRIEVTTWHQGSISSFGGEGKHIRNTFSLVIRDNKPLPEKRKAVIREESDYKEGIMRVSVPGRRRSQECKTCQSYMRQAKTVWPLQTPTDDPFLFLGRWSKKSSGYKIR